ncbi:MAG: hypothetical protein N2037_00370 [Acidimicrobiales bacterium]|nr:hypothetical protein [Acidimicrobiales bacterium]
MPSGDGWLVRARVGCRPVTPDQWAMVGELAARMGNGLVELTSRGNLQIRGLAARDTQTVTSGLIECGLVCADTAADRRRLVVVNPLAGLAPDGVLTSHLRVEAHGQSSVTVPVTQSPESGEFVKGELWAGEADGGRHRLGTASAAPGVNPATIATEVDVLAGVEDLVEHFGDQLPAKWWAVVDAGAPWPMAVASCDVALCREPGGWQVLVAGKTWQRVAHPIPVARELAERCASDRCRASELTCEAPEPAPVVTDTRTAWWGARLFGDVTVTHVAPVFGVMHAGDAQLLAELSGTPVTLRPTPQRGVLLIAAQAFAPRLSGIVDQLAARGWIVAGDDPRRMWSACIGSRGCDSALIDTWAVADQLAVASPSAPTHISGCPKRCGAPPGARELIATVDGLVEVGA